MDKELGLARLAPRRIVACVVELGIGLLAHVAALEIADDPTMVNTTLSSVNGLPSGLRAPKYRLAIVSLITAARGADSRSLAAMSRPMNKREDGMKELRANPIEGDLAFRIRVRHEPRHVQVPTGVAPAELAVVGERSRLYRSARG